MHLLNLAVDSPAPALDLLRQSGDATLAEFLESMGHATTQAPQGRDDLWRVIEDQATLHYGAEVAREAVAELRLDPTVPTSNHFGIDTFADSVQGTLLFGLRRRPDGGPKRTVVVLGCSSVSLDNLTYPMGLLLYDPRDGRVPQRLPLFPNRFRRWTVGSAPPIEEASLVRARDRLRAMPLGEFAKQAAARTLEEDIPAALALPTYGRQATRINTRLWSRMSTGSAMPTLVQLELESVCAALVREDLGDPSSIVWRLMFSGLVREALLTGLDGARACWNLDNLRRRLTDPVGDAQARDGTVFFWGLTGEGRRVPLTLREHAGGMRLAGIDERRRTWEWEFSPQSLAEALGSGQLIPSLITCFAALAFARGVVCIGGHYQAAYLPVMQRGVHEALRLEDKEAADLIARVPTWRYLAGMQMIMRMLPDGAGIPAGPVEIGGCGGLTDADLTRILEITVQEAHLAAFPEFFPHLVPDAEVPDDWMRRLTLENPAACRRLVRLG